MYFREKIRSKNFRTMGNGPSSQILMKQKPFEALDEIKILMVFAAVQNSKVTELYIVCCNLITNIEVSINEKND